MESRRYSADASTQQPGAHVTVDLTGQTRHRDAAAADTTDDVGSSTQYSGMIQQKDEAHRRLTRVINGCLDDLPPLQSKIVRIFTSSTFTGQTLSCTFDHNALINHAHIDSQDDVSYIRTRSAQQKVSVGKQNQNLTVS